MLKKILLLITIFYSLNVFSMSNSFIYSLKTLETDLKSYQLIKAREYLAILQSNGVDKEEWLKLRDLIHQYPQIGMDVLIKFDQTSPLPLNKVDRAIAEADKLMTEKKFYKAAYGYQEILKYMTKQKNFKKGRNIQLYWSLIHSLARAFYALKQYDEAFVLYQSIPQSYPYFRQVHFELMWNNYMNDRLDYALGNIASMSAGEFSKLLEPEVYLVQYYIYKRLCRDQDAEFIKKRVRAYHKALELIDLKLGSWIKKDIVTLMYKQILLSGKNTDDETMNLMKTLEKEKSKDFSRLKKEFDMVAAHVELDSGKNVNLKPITAFKNIEDREDKIIYPTSMNENWKDEIGKYVYIDNGLCK